MKRTMWILAISLLAGGAMAQNDKEAAKQLKLAKKEAKVQMADAQKIKDDIYAKVSSNTQPIVQEKEIFSACKNGQELIQKAIKSGLIDERKWGEAYKLSADLAVLPHNLYLEDASQKLPLDTMAYFNNLKILTNSVSNELKHTEKTTGETGNEKYLNDRLQTLAKSAIYYVYAAQFEQECRRYASALEAYDMALNYEEKYPEVAGKVNMGVSKGQIAYYAFHVAYEAKNYPAMDKYYELAKTFPEGLKGTNQVRIMSYLEQGDTLKWASSVREECLQDPANNEDYIQILSAYYQTQSFDAMAKFADEVLALDPSIYIANYARAFAAFSAEKYDEALKYYTTCTEIKPEQYDAWYQCGLCKYRKAMNLNSTISSIKNRQVAQKTLEQTKALFGEAIPYFEKARSVTPDEPMKWAYELKQCYTVVGRAAEAAQMDKLL